MKLELLTRLGSFCFGSFSVFRADKKFWGKKLPQTSGKDKMNDRTRDLENELVSRLKTFGHLYDQQAEGLHAATDLLEQMVKGGIHILRLLVVEAGQVATCLLGGFSGGIYGTISALVWSNGHGKDVTFGFVGSILGGVVGGALGGAICGAVTIWPKLAGSPDRDFASDTAWLFGFAAGGVAGGAIGGPLGATGGALGGLLGACWAIQLALNSGRSVARMVLERLKITVMPVDEPVSDDLTGCLGDFRTSVKPLQEELRYIQVICDQMVSHQHVHAIATHTAASLDAQAKMEALLVKARRADCLFEMVSAMLAVAQLCRNINEELEGLRRSVETFSPQLSGTPEDPPSALD